MKAITKMIWMVILFVSFCTVNVAQAVTNWGSTPLTNWELYLNNGVAYILSSELPGHCAHSRAQIKMSGTEFDKAQYAYALSAKARDKRMNYVVDFDTSISTCVISGLREAD